MTFVTKDPFTKENMFPHLKWSEPKLIEEQIKKDKYGEGVACFLVGDFYKDGKGTTKDYLMALEWYLKAVKHDHKYSCYRLGEFFEKGNGVTSNEVMALEWYYKHNKNSMDVERLIRCGVDKTNIKTERSIAILVKEAEAILQLKKTVPEKESQNNLKNEVQLLKQKEEKSKKEQEMIRAQSELLKTENGNVKEKMLQLANENTKLKQIIANYERQFQQMCNHCNKITLDNLPDNHDLCYDSGEENYMQTDGMKNCDTSNGHDNGLCYSSKEQSNVNVNSKKNGDTPIAQDINNEVI